MRSFRRYLLVLASALVALPMCTRAGELRGSVKNGTTGKAAPGIEIILLQLQGGMQPVANAKSDAQGQFAFNDASITGQPMLVRASYHGVNFNSAVPPGSSTVQVDIYESSKDAKTINVASHVVIFQPNGSTLLVGEEYQIQNKSQPPQAYFRGEGNFDFSLPEKGELRQVAAAGPAGMPIVQLPIDKKKNRYAIAFAFRPGDSTVRYSYELPYGENVAAVKLPTIYPGGRLLVVAPPTVQVSGEGLSPSGEEQGMSLYSRDDVPAGTMVAVNLSGTAPPPNANAGGGDQGQQGRDAQQGGAEAGGAAIQAVPGRLETMKWPLVGVLALFFGVFAYLLSRKQVVVAGPEAEVAETRGPRKEKKPATQAAAPSAPASSPVHGSVAAPTNGASTLKEVDAAIGTSLDALKESLFRLELRRQAGTISEEEYTRERAKTEKVLRDLVRG